MPLTEKELKERDAKRDVGAELLQAPRLLASGHFNEGKLLAILNPVNSKEGSALEQWQRLVSLECTLQRYGT